MSKIEPIQTKLKGLYSQIAGAAKEAQGQIERLDSEIRNRTAERERLMRLPLSKEDFIAQFRKQVKSTGSLHATFMKGDIAELDLTVNYAKRTDAGFDFLVSRRGIGNVQISQLALCYFFEDQIVDGVRRVVDDLDWPPDAVSSLAEIETGIKRLDDEIEQLETERAGYIDVLRSYKITN